MSGGIRIEESCCCGATFEGSGLNAYVASQAQEFRDAHGVCRGQVADGGGTVGFQLSTRRDDLLKVGGSD